MVIIMKVADFLTLLRIILTPVLVFFLFKPFPHQQWFAAGIFILAALTDGLDGYVARARNESTNFGKSFDPLADKILISAALISLCILGEVSCWAVFIILGREILITILRSVASKKGISVGAGIWGKIKTFTQIVAIIMIILSVPGAEYMLYAAVFFTVFSGLDYLIKWRAIFSTEKD